MWIYLFFKKKRYVDKQAVSMTRQSEKSQKRLERKPINNGVSLCVIDWINKKQSTKKKFQRNIHKKCFFFCQLKIIKKRIKWFFKTKKVVGSIFKIWTKKSKIYGTHNKNEIKRKRHENKFWAQTKWCEFCVCLVCVSHTCSRVNCIQDMWMRKFVWSNLKLNLGRSIDYLDLTIYSLTIDWFFCIGNFIWLHRYGLLRRRR